MSIIHELLYVMKKYEIQNDIIFTSLQLPESTYDEQLGYFVDSKDAIESYQQGISVDILSNNALPNDHNVVAIADKRYVFSRVIDKDNANANNWFIFKGNNFNRDNLHPFYFDSKVYPDKTDSPPKH